MSFQELSVELPDSPSHWKHTLQKKPQEQQQKGKKTNNPANFKEYVDSTGRNCKTIDFLNEFEEILQRRQIGFNTFL